MPPFWKIGVIALLALTAEEFARCAWRVSTRTDAVQARATASQPASPMAATMDAAHAAMAGPADSCDSTNYTEALAEALRITDQPVRTAEVSRLLRAWTAFDPVAALQWAQSQTGVRRRHAILDVLAGAGTQPEAEFRLGLLLRGQGSAQVAEDGTAVIRTLEREKHFEAALKFAEGVSGETSSSWLVSIFTAWGASEPQAALQALLTVDPACHEAAFQAFMESWSTSQPTESASYVLSLPPGEDRTTALSTLSARWSLQDPVAMADWLSGAPRSPDLDNSIAEVATRSDRANRPTGTAIHWAENITDPELRFVTVAYLIQEWTQTDVAAARTYVQSASWLTPIQRDSLMQMNQTQEKKL